MNQSVDKSHDGVMNSIDSQLENITGLSWLEISSTEEYEVISKAVWRICAGQTTNKEED